MASYINMTNQTYRSPLYQPRKARPAMQRPWQERYRPARKADDGRSEDRSRRTSIVSNSQKSQILNKGSYNSYTASDGDTTISNSMAPTQVLQQPVFHPGMRSGYLTSAKGARSTPNPSDTSPNIYRDLPRQPAESSSDSSGMSGPARTSGTSSRSSTAWGGRDDDTEWTWVLGDGQDVDIESLLQGGKPVVKAVTPGVRFGQYNWQQKVQELYLQNDAINTDLNVRRQKRMTRKCPWKKAGRENSPDGSQTSISGSIPYRNPELLTTQLRIDPSKPTQMNRWAVNSKVADQPSGKSTPINGNPPANGNTENRLKVPSWNTVGKTSSTGRRFSDEATRLSTPGADYSGKMQKPFGSDTEEWLRQNDFSIWLKKRAPRRSAELSDKFVLRDKSAASSRGHSGKKGQYDHIGPHRDFYHEYAEEKLVAEDQNRATLVLQKFLRGYMQRHRFRRLRDRIIMKHSGTFKRFVREYKGLLTRIQKRSGVAKPQTPWVYKDVVRFLDRKEKYEKTFFNLAIADKMPRNMLKRYFKECGHEPTDFMVNEAYTNVFKGCGSKADIVFIVDCSASVGNNNFKVQADFVKELVSALHVGENNVRVGYVPYNTDVYQSFDLDMYDNADSIIQGIGRVRYHKGLTRTDRALAKMREMFKSNRPDVPRIAILITDGKSDSSEDTLAQATGARKNDKIQLLVVGVGDKTDMAELIDIGGTRGNVFLVPNYIALWRVKTAIMKKCKIANCTYCHWVAPTDLQVDTTRGLYKEEALEILWQMFPPRSTGIIRQPRDIHFIDSGEELAYRKRTLRLIEQKEAFYSTSLSFAIKSKLDKNGFSRGPPDPTGDGSSRPAWVDSVDAATLYLAKEKDKARKEEEEKEKKEKKEREKQARDEEMGRKAKGKPKEKALKKFFND